MNGSRIAFFAPDLEQVVHRGIAIYTKMLLKCTFNAGHTNYLITGARGSQVARLVQQILIEKHLQNPTYQASRTALLAQCIKSQLHPAPFMKVEREHPTEISDRLSFLPHLQGFLNRRLIYPLAQNIQPKLTKSAYRLNISKEFQLVFCASPANIQVPRHTKLVQTVHDVIPITRNDHPDETSIFYRRLRNMLRHSDLVLSVSETSRQDLLAIFPEYAEKVVTTYEPIPDIPWLQLRQTDSLFTLRKYQLQPKNYLLFVSCLEKRKNVARLVEAYLGIQEKVNLPLVIVGEQDGGNPEIIQHLNSLPFESGVRYLGFVSNCDKFILQQNALAFIFPSLYEGFGIPPLEAMQAGCPVVVSKTGSLPEVCADAALYIDDPQSVRSIAKEMLAVVKSPTLRQQLSMAGYIRAGEFSFGRYQQRLDELLKSLFGVRSSEFGVRGSEFGVRGSEFGVRGSEFGVRGSGMKPFSHFAPCTPYLVPHASCQQLTNDQ